LPRIRVLPAFKAGAAKALFFPFTQDALAFHALAHALGVPGFFDIKNVALQ